VEYVLADLFQVLRSVPTWHLVTPMLLARQSVSVTPRCPARPKGLDLQIFVWMGFFKNEIEK